MNLTSQTNIIAGAILLAFVMFITLRGELPQYLGLFKPQAAPSGGSSPSSSGGSTASTVATVATTAKTIADIAAITA